MLVTHTCVASVLSAFDCALLLQCMHHTAKSKFTHAEFDIDFQAEAAFSVVMFSLVADLL